MLSRLGVLKPLLTGALLLLASFAFTQKTVSGKVTTGLTSQPVIGATVRVKETADATITDTSGYFTIGVPNQESVLVITSAGFEPMEVPVGSEPLVNVSLKEIDITLSQVVVTGYTRQAKKDITGSVAVVNVKDLVANPGPNIQNLLQGQAAGVFVGTSGVPGAGSNVRIRGYSTFGNNEPLYVVDGTRVGSITQLNPNDIETIQVLKDASAASIYGSAAAGGVIIVTTKQGKTGKPSVAYSSYYGRQSFDKRWDLMNTKEYGDYLFLLAKNSGSLDAQGRFTHGQYAGPTGASDHPIIPDYIYAGGKENGGKNGGIAAGDPAAEPSKYKLDLFDVNGRGTYLIVPANKEGTDWLGAILQKAAMQNHTVSVSGGGDHASYFYGLDYVDQKGIVATTRYQRYSLRVNTSFTIKNKVRLGEHLQVYFTNRSGVQAFINQNEQNPIAFAYRMQPIIPVFDIKGNYAGTRGDNLGNVRNPYSELDRRRDAREKRNGIIGSIYFEADLLQHLTFRSNLGTDYGNGSSYVFVPPIYESRESNSNIATFNEAQNYGFQLTWFNTLNFRKAFGKAHTVSGMVGMEIVQNQGRSVSASASDYFNLDRNFWQVSSTLNPTPMGGSNEYRNRKYSPVIAQLVYAYHDKYLFTGSFRRDGSSDAFGPSHKYGNFPAMSLAWRISKEPFFERFKGINDLKIRYGYGILGNDNIRDLGFLTFFTINNNAAYPLSGSNSVFSPGLSHQTISNPDIRWEKTTTSNLGIDAAFLKNKMALSLDLYNQETTDLLFEKELDPNLYGGSIVRMPINIGSMNNKGVDLSLSYRGGLDRALRYDANLNFTLYRNKVGKLADPFFEGDRTRIDPFNRSVTGRPISSFYGYVLDGFFDDSSELVSLEQSGKFVGGWKYKDLSGPDGKPDGRITPDDRTFIGNPHPKFITGFNGSLAYKNFDLSCFIYWKAGGELVNYTRSFTDFNTFQGNRSRRVLYDSWTPENRHALLPRVQQNDATSGQLPVNYYIEPGGYLRLRNLMLGFTLPEKTMHQLGIDRLRFYVQAQNLFTITKYTGLDPEITNYHTGRNDYNRSLADRNLGVDIANYPTPKAYIFGLELEF